MKPKKVSLWSIVLTALLFGSIPLVTAARAQAYRQAGTAHAAELGPQPSAVARIDMNVAGMTELLTLPGIGPTKAQAIIDARERQRFRRIEDLLRVRGIGRATLRRLEPLVVVGNPPQAVPRTARQASRSNPSSTDAGVGR